MLEALLAAGVRVPNRCRAGVCQTCLVQVVEGRVPASAQHGLSKALKAQAYILACVGFPDGLTKIALGGGVHRKVAATVVSRDRLTPDVVRLCLAPQAPFAYRSGQFIALEAGYGNIRNYSIASCPLDDPVLELHIRLLPGGLMSRFLSETVNAGDSLIISGPFGACFYEGIERDQPLVLVGTGTGIAPLWGILRDALMCGHDGPIQLYHGANGQVGLYLDDQIRALAAKHRQVSYYPVAYSESDDGRGVLATRVLKANDELAKTVFFICGAPDMVRSLKKSLFLKGVKLDRLLSDAFVPAGSFGT